MKILLDVNLSPQWGVVLNHHGFFCVHWSQIGDTREKDGAIMEWARENGHVVLTHDLDFGAMLALTQAAGPSVIQIRTQDVLSEWFEKTLLMILRNYEKELDSGVLIVVNEQRLRLRMLSLEQ